MKRALVALFLAIVALPAWVSAGTIEVGEVRTVQGKVIAVDVVNRTVVLEVKTDKGPLVASAEFDEAVSPKAGAKSLTWDAVPVGGKAKLRYTRRDGRLVGLDLQTKP